MNFLRVKIHNAQTYMDYEIYNHEQNSMTNITLNDVLW